jgi:hypothetical protein
MENLSSAQNADDMPFGQHLPRHSRERERSPLAINFNRLGDSSDHERAVETYTRRRAHKTSKQPRFGTCGSANGNELVSFPLDPAIIRAYQKQTCFHD